MERKNLNEDNKKLKELEEAELTVTLFDKDDIVANSDCTSSANLCLAKGTLVAMADGSFKNIEDITEKDIVLSFDHKKGCFIGSEVFYVYKGDVAKRAFTCCFASEAKLSIVGKHDLFELESRKYVTLTEDNADLFIGKHFYSADEKAYVELINIVHETEEKEYYSIYAKNTLNIVANGMLNVAADINCMLNLYELDENLKADERSLAEDIQKYGIYEYDGVSKEEYDAWNMRYLNIAVGKGLITWDQLWNQHAEYTEQRSKGAFECA